MSLPAWAVAIVVGLLLNVIATARGYGAMSARLTAIETAFQKFEERVFKKVFDGSPSDKS